jgi:spore maturation protein SpmB
MTHNEPVNPVPSLSGMILRGTRKALVVTYDLAKVMVPIYVATAILRDSGILFRVSDLLQPVTSAVGLPGEASLVLILGVLVNLYAALGAMAGISLTPEQVTILSMMLLTCHSLPMEATVTQKLGLPAWIAIGLRATLAALVGFVLNLLL